MDHIIGEWISIFIPCSDAPVQVKQWNHKIDEVIRVLGHIITCSGRIVPSFYIAIMSPVQLVPDFIVAKSYKN
jgi:hypothetical protein